MAQPRPSLTLILDLDERLDSEDVRLEIDRCYSYVGSTLVRTHPACDGEPQNIMRFLVKLGTRRYLRRGRGRRRAVERRYGALVLQRAVQGE